MQIVDTRGNQTDWFTLNFPEYSQHPLKGGSAAIGQVYKETGFTVLANETHEVH